MKIKVGFWSIMFGQLVNFVKMAGYFCVNFEEFWSIFGHLPTFCPLLKTKVATQKPRIYAGLRGFWSKTHFYFYLIVKKKLIYIYRFAKKSGLLTKTIKITHFYKILLFLKFAKKTCPFMRERTDFSCLSFISQTYLRRSSDNSYKMNSFL